MTDNDHHDDRPRPPLPGDEPPPAPPVPPVPAVPAVPAEPPAERGPEPVVEQSAAVAPTMSQAKSPPLAAVLSFILPGLGHLYTESYQRSAMIFSSFVLSIFLSGRWWPFIFLCIFLWFFGMFDSFREAQIINRGGDEVQTATRRSSEGTFMFGVFLLVGGGMLLLDNFGLVDFDWFFDDWWPVVVVAAGLYFIIGAFRERRSQT
jgi:hypothetical protein